MLSLFFLSSGLFLGWSLGANDAANIFGPAVGSKMLRFRTAALVSALFVVVGAGISGSGAAKTLGELGKINELAGAFMIALASALTVFWMTRLNFPVSTSQAIVGSIVGWNFFTGSLTDYNSLVKIVGSWVFSPVLAAIFSLLIYQISRGITRATRLHILYLDMTTRAGFLLVAAFGAYSLGANNIANVMGVFVPVSPFGIIKIGSFVLHGTEQLFVLGGIAIAIGIVSYSEKVIKTVGSSLVRLTPLAGFVVALSSSLVLFIFASHRLKAFLISLGLPSVPLVPVSSSQVVVGAVVGIGLASGGRGVNFAALGRVASAWITTPLVAGTVSFVSLFFIQNVFNQKVYKPEPYRIDAVVTEALKKSSLPYKRLGSISNKTYDNARQFLNALKSAVPDITEEETQRILSVALICPIKVDLRRLDNETVAAWFTMDQFDSLKRIDGYTYKRKWIFREKLISLSGSWAESSDAGRDNGIATREERIEYLVSRFRLDVSEDGNIIP